MMAGVAALERRLWATGLAGAALLALVVALVSRRITRPLVHLTKAAQDVAAGRLDAPLPDVASHDEVGRLTRALNRMVRRLAELGVKPRQIRASGPYHPPFAIQIHRPLSQLTMYLMPPQDVSTR